MQMRTWGCPNCCDIQSVLAAKSLLRSGAMFSGDQANYPEAAWIGRVLPNDPGTATWNLKTLAGITVDNLSAAQISVLDAKKANYYVTIGGVNVTQNGNMAGGEWIDIVQAIDWLEARIQEDVYSALINVEKLPFTDAGIQVVEGKVRGVLEAARKANIVASYTVTVPKAADVPQADRAARILTGVEFEAILAGAVHKVKIDGFVSV